MSKKYLMLLGIFLISSAGHAVEYQCYDPVSRKTVGSFGGLGKMAPAMIASKCRTLSPYCETGKCTLPLTKLKK